ncbi:LacI family DNA-binding transcriptional regulator [Rhizobium sp. G187]|uniref:LacI family DNA-binding transcriptional regulator n=1 Tax=Rhizobium sp. G187 TaxID=3451352 RepID=UPI003EE738E3
MEKQKLGPPTDRVTIRHVAEHAGVSVAAVSKVLRNAYGVSEALRTKVEHAIDLLKYRPSTAARAMRGRTYTVGILVVELTNPFVPVLLEGIDAGLAEANYKAMVGVGRAASKLETSMIESMIDTRMDGLVLIGPQISGSVVAHYAKQIPIVAIAHHEPQATLYDTVNSDDFAGAQMAVEALASCGYSDIAMLSYDRSDSPNSVVAVQREAGYKAAMAAIGSEERARIIRNPHPSEPRSKELAALLSSEDRPRAIFAWSDLDAIPLLAACHELGIDVPGTLAVIGYDDCSLAGQPAVSLSSVNQDPLSLGARASELLLSRIEGREDAQHVMLPPRVVLRRSV